MSRENPTRSFAALTMGAVTDAAYLASRPAMDEIDPDHWDDLTPTLADIMAATGQALGVPTQSPGGAIPELPQSRDVVILLIDGLGATLLAQHAADAPTLSRFWSSESSTTLRAGFPATTATSLTSLTMGADCGVHGIIGYSFRPDDDSRTRGTARTLNALRWTLDSSNGPSAMKTYPPALIQYRRTALEDLADAGVKINYVMPGEFKGTGLTMTTFRAPGRHIAAITREGVRTGIGLALNRITAVGRSSPRLVYAYYGRLDMTGHLHGPGSQPWIDELRRVDALVADIASDLGPDTTLLITGDHGMITPGVSIDIDTTPALTAGTAAIAGEARVRQIYAEDGAADDVLAAWRAVVGENAHIASRAEAIDRGWFRTPPDSRVAQRLGDVIAVARGDAVLVRGEKEPLEAKLTGQHGAWTTAEQLVPLLVARP